MGWVIRKHGWQLGVRKEHGAPLQRPAKDLTKRAEHAQSAWSKGLYDEAVRGTTGAAFAPESVGGRDTARRV